jgi:hypothetical protein
MNRKKLYEVLKLTRFLLDCVNSKEEYDYLIREEEKLLSLLSSFNAQYLKGGKSQLIEDVR